MMDEESGDYDYAGGKECKHARMIEMKDMVGWIMSMGGESNCGRMIQS